jgi:hypothetical protein
LVESLDDFAELVLHVHPDRLKEVIGTASLSLTNKDWHNNCSIALIDIEFKEKHLKGGN